MKIYRYITGPDDAKFCHRITSALNGGWELYGSPTLTYDTKQQRTICGQAIIKEVMGKEYDPNIDISKL